MAMSFSHFKKVVDAGMKRMSRYCKFCDNAVAQLENPEFEDWQGSFTFTNQ